MRIGVTLALLILGTLALGGCLPGKPAWAYYDECSVHTASFREMVDCGKQSRTSGCKAGLSCSANGNTVVAYADSLVASVDSKEISEPEAQRRWIDFRGRMESRKVEADLADAVTAPRSPVTCTSLGGITTCR